ncbi:hypothetical protein RhiirC2_715651 [Rhizophagus irregularis]|uniref:Uncharacterized protein n=1 Tax=Rhizophagus irregularis TaxID=588596 RepID=A0A2N1MUL4_9GLOM|nr:hypothetical protein RhiirC2_715651 [Rhizophagus irregularis]
MTETEIPKPKLYCYTVIAFVIREIRWKTGNWKRRVKVSDIVSDFGQGFRFQKAVFEYQNCPKPETETRPKLGVGINFSYAIKRQVLRNISLLGGPVQFITEHSEQRSVQW